MRRRSSAARGLRSPSEAKGGPSLTHLSYHGMFFVRLQRPEIVMSELQTPTTDELETATVDRCACTCMRHNGVDNLTMGSG